MGDKESPAPSFDPEIELTPEEVRALPFKDQFTYCFLRGMRAETAEDREREAAKAAGALPAFKVPDECIVEVVDADDKHFRV